MKLLAYTLLSPVALLAFTGYICGILTGALFGTFHAGWHMARCRVQEKLGG